jgi:hypothetical protein
MTPSKSPVALRLGKLAEAGRTGSLDLSGDSGGVIYVSAGDIVAADSHRTPGLAARTRKEEAGSFEWTWLATEATIDAAMDLMSVRPLHVRFTEPEGDTGHRLLEQIAAVLTPDVEVARNPRLRAGTGGHEGVRRGRLTGPTPWPGWQAGDLRALLLRTRRHGPGPTGGTYGAPGR